MREYVKETHHAPLFSGIKIEELDAMLTCIGSYIRQYKKGEFILLSEESVQAVGLVLEGTIHMIKEDIWGNKAILTMIQRHGLFGETFACGSQLNSAVSFYSATNCRVLYLPFYKVIHACNLSCIFHHRLIENMVRLIADKNAQLMEKVEIISKKTLRDKILTYLSLQAQIHKKNEFEIPFGRLELADYLCADRSALTRELNSMKKDGVIDFEKNHFQILKENG